MSDDLNLLSVDFQSNLRSKPIRQNFSDIQNNYNLLRSEFQTSVSATASEVTNARDNLSALEDNIHLRSQNGSFINTGGLVTAQGTPDNTIRISSGSGMIDGIGVSFNSATSATVGAPTTGRLDVVTINNDNTLSIELGNDSADKILPALSSTQRPLAYITQDTANPLTIAQSDITEIRRQGCYANGKWFFKIQDAIDYISSGEIKVNAGDYYEELDLTGKSNIQITGQKGVNIYRPSATEYCIKSLNSGGSETTGISIKDVSLFGNGKAGAIELLKFEYTDKFHLEGIEFDGNSSSTATYKNLVINQCDDLYLNGILGSGTYNQTNNTNYQFLLSDNALFSNDMTVANDLTVTNDVSANNLTAINNVNCDLIDSNKGYTPAVVYRSSGGTLGDVYNAFSAALPNVGDLRICTGRINNVVIAYMERVSSTQIRVYGSLPTGTLTSNTYTSGDGGGIGTAVSIVI